MLGVRHIRERGAERRAAGRGHLHPAEPAGVRRLAREDARPRIRPDHDRGRHRSGASEPAEAPQAGTTLAQSLMGTGDDAGRRTVFDGKRARGHPDGRVFPEWTVEGSGLLPGCRVGAAIGEGGERRLMTHAADATGERRQLTAFFCDLVGSTELSAHLDLDDYFEVIRAYHGRSAALVARYGGHVAQYQGDGFLAYFGYPHAHEDATERAVRAALAILDALCELNTELERERKVRLSLRIGIHTGTVVLGETGGGKNRELLAMGETVNLAARLQAIAAADSIVISGDSERLVRGRFDTEDLGLQHLKGLSRPIVAYRV